MKCNATHGACQLKTGNSLEDLLFGRVEYSGAYGQSHASHFQLRQSDFSGHILNVIEQVRALGVRDQRTV